MQQSIDFVSDAPMHRKLKPLKLSPGDVDVHPPKKAEPSRAPEYANPAVLKLRIFRAYRVTRDVMARRNKTATLVLTRTASDRIVRRHLSQRGYSTYDVRVRAVEAVVRRGIAVGEVAEAYDTDRTTLFRWIKRYRQDGENGLHRQAGSGRPRKLKELVGERLWNLVLQPATHFGYETDLWTVGRVHEVVQDELKVVISKDTIWRRLREAGLTYQKPERQYFEADDEARQEWVERRLPEIRETVRKHRAILYFQDEANVSLTAFLGKTWAPRGKTPKAEVTGGRGGVAALSAISKRGHLLFALYEKRIASDEVIHFLAQMLRHHRGRHLVVLMDNAPPHTSRKTLAFIDSQPRLHIFNFPSYSPDWNPDEKVWNHLKHQELKSHKAKTKAELKELTERKLNGMANDPHLVRGLFFRCCVADLFG